MAIKYHASQGIKGIFFAWIVDLSSLIIFVFIVVFNKFMPFLNRNFEILRITSLRTKLYINL